MSDPLELPDSPAAAPPPRPVNFYRLLGLKEFESDLAAIQVAAEAALRRLDEQASEPDARQQLADELTLARLCLTNPARKRQYDERLREEIIEGAEGVGTIAPPDVDLAPPAPDRPALAGAGEPAASCDAVDFRPGDLLPPSSLGGTGRSRPVALAAPDSRPPAGSAPLARLVVVPPPIANAPQPLAVPHAVVGDSSHEAGATPTFHDAALADELDVPEPGRRRSARRPVATIGPGLAIVIVAALAGAIVLAVQRQPGREQTSRVASGGQSSRPTPAADTPQPAANRPAAVPSDPRGDGDASTRLAAASDAPSESPPSPPPPDDSPPASPATDRPSAAIDAEKSVAFAQALSQARAALSARDVARARRQLQAAEPLAQTDDDATRRDRLETLAEAVENFWAAVGKGLAGLNATDELPVGSTIVAVVEVSESAITVRAEGANRSYTTENMPAWLAVALARRWLDGRAGSSLVFLGAFQAVDPGGSAAEARQLWNAAQARGESVADLLPLLDEAAAAPPGERGAAPPAKAVNLAAKGIKARFAAGYRLAARSRDAKRELAESLLAAASESSAPAEGFALFREARELAVGAADAALVVRVIDGWEQRYQVDADRERLEGLKKVVNTIDAEGARAAAKLLLELVDRTLADGRSALAAQLCRLATSAARKSRDAELVAAAASREKQFNSTADPAP